MKVTGMLAAVGVAVLISLGGATSASAHSGGLDGNGCHAGSQPYHCHRGPSAGSSGGGSSMSSSSGTTSSVPSGPSPAQLAAIDHAESAVDRSRAELVESRERVDAVSGKLSVANEKLETQRRAVEKLHADVADLQTKADRLRDERVEKRSAADKRVRLVAASNRERLENHKSDRRAMGFMAGLFGGFLLLGFVRRLGVALAVGRPLVLIGGLVASFVVATIGFAIPWAPGGILISLVGGTLLACVFMLARVWWIGLRLPRFVAFGLLGVAAFLAIGSLGAAMSATPPAAEQPATQDAALVAEQQADPDAENYEPALEVEREAEGLAAEVEALDTSLEAQQARIDALGAKLKKAEAQVETKQSEVAEAEDVLATLE